MGPSNGATRFFLSNYSRTESWETLFLESTPPILCIVSFWSVFYVLIEVRHLLFLVVNGLVLIRVFLQTF